MAKVKLDDLYNSNKYQENLNKAKSLGFKGTNASNFAIDLTAQDLQYDAGDLPEITVTPGVKRKYITDLLGGNRVTYNDYQGKLNMSGAQHSANIVGGMLAVPMAATVGAGIVVPMAAEAGVGLTVSAVMNNPWVLGIFAADGIRNTVSDNGILKTYRIGKDIYENGLTGRKAWDFTKSSIGDVLDITGGLGTLKRGFNTGRKLLGFVDNIPYSPRNWYRSVGKDAIIDANSTGIIRGPESKSFPYFGRGKEGFTFRNYVIEGSPESANWEQAFAYERGKHIQQPKEPITINGKPLDVSYGTAGNDKYGDFFEAFPVMNGNANATPTTNFTYWKKYPVLGWKQKKFILPKLILITAENASKITPELWDLAYNKAIEIGDLEEALRLRDLHFLAKAPETKTTGTYANNSRFGQDFTVFDRNKITGPNPETGYMFDPRTGEFVGTYNPEGRGFFFRPEEFDQLVEEGARHYKLNITNPRTSYTERTIADNLLKPDLFGNPQFVPKTNNGIITKEIINGKEVPFEVLAMQPEQIKLADAVTYDNSGKVIPLSKRDNFTNPDIRYMLALPLAGAGIVGTQKKFGGKLNYTKFYK